jgi:hypothetical protein
MGHLDSNRSDKFFGPTHSTGCLDVTDALETIVSIKPQLEHSIEVLPKHGRIMFTSSNEFGHKRSLKPRVAPLCALYAYMSQGCLRCPEHGVVRPAGRGVV